MNIILLDKTITFIKYFCINIIQNVMKKKKKIGFKCCFFCIILLHRFEKIIVQRDVKYFSIKKKNFQFVK